MENIFKEITFRTIKKCKTREVVLPSEYSKIFKGFTVEKGINLEDEEILLKNLFYDEDKLKLIVKETSNNLFTLEDSTKKASNAIKENDTQTLSLIQEELSSMKEKINFLQKELFTDSLTKVNNRKWFSDIYLKEDKFPNDGFLIFIDLDKFKFINDNYGHLIGDQVLKYFCVFLKKELIFRDIDIVRYAGDEFIILLKDSSINKSKISEEMSILQKKLSNLKLKAKTSKNESFSFCFSYGVVPYKKDDDSINILEKADQKMYKNKSR